MLLIACPWCGPRAEIEFVWSGEAHLQRPDATEATDTIWGDYLFVRANTKGPQAERWRHADGCRQWFNVVRDTTTHSIVAVYRLDQPRPDENAR